jgi:hypothetical protein
MTVIRLTFGALATIFLASFATTICQASTMYVDPDTLPPNARERALYGPLNNTDPWGEPARPGCTWSRIQMQTGQGLQWVAMEDCDIDHKPS